MCADRSAGFTFYLWGVDDDAVRRAAVENFAKATHNVLLRRRAAADEHLELITRCKHAQPTSAGERRLIARVFKALDRMDAAVLRLHETLMLFTLMGPRDEDPLEMMRPAGDIHDAQLAAGGFLDGDSSETD